ncbi:peptidase M24 [Saccharibacillus sp. O23]|uniref:M23 family metallopeptidase n=1 Tax=Saccharibacillus sp. O23 TaxID=2009338 RepID=UPI000B4E6E9C|nr:peptidase M24 [Saccharibacillus sp. O23]
MALWLLPVVLWAIVYLWRGVPSVLAWWLIQAYSLVAVLITAALLVIGAVKLLPRILRSGKRGRGGPALQNGEADRNAGIEEGGAGEKRKREFRPPLRALLIAGAIAGAWPALWFAGVGQIAYPADAAKTSPSVTVVSPFAKETIVGWGGDGLRENYHVAAPNERWAYDLLAAPAGMGSARLEDYGIYGASVFAPAAGTVVEAKDGEADHAPGESEPETLAGNHIYLRLDETGTYLVFAHLMRGSAAVEAGQHVEVGEPLGRVGNSGSSSEPHLHLHHQRQNPAETNLFLSEGLPLYFKSTSGAFMPSGGVEVQGGRDVPTGEKLAPQSGLFSAP